MPGARTPTDLVSLAVHGVAFGIFVAVVLWATRFLPSPDEQWKAAPVALRQQMQKFFTCAARAPLPSSINGPLSVCGVPVTYRGPGKPLAQCFGNPNLREVGAMAPAITGTTPTTWRANYRCGRGFIQIEANQSDDGIWLTAVRAGPF
jgi:hypothetical protein